jgi:hypothetical protein
MVMTSEARPEPPSQRSRKPRHGTGDQKKECSRAQSISVARSLRRSRAGFPLPRGRTRESFIEEARAFGAGERPAIDAVATVLERELFLL